MVSFWPDGTSLCDSLLSRQGRRRTSPVLAVVNAFLWIQEIVSGGELEYACWVTIPWGIGLFAHTIAYPVGARPALRRHRRSAGQA